MVLCIFEGKADRDGRGRFTGGVAHHQPPPAVISGRREAPDGLLGRGEQPGLRARVAVDVRLRAEVIARDVPPDLHVPENLRRVARSVLHRIVSALPLCGRARREGEGHKVSAPLHEDPGGARRLDRSQWQHNNRPTRGKHAPRDHDLPYLEGATSHIWVRNAPMEDKPTPTTRPIWLRACNECGAELHVRRRNCTECGAVQVSRRSQREAEAAALAAKNAAEAEDAAIGLTGLASVTKPAETAACPPNTTQSPPYTAPRPSRRAAGAARVESAPPPSVTAKAVPARGREAESKPAPQVRELAQYSAWMTEVWKAIEAPAPAEPTRSCSNLSDGSTVETSRTDASSPAIPSPTEAAPAKRALGASFETPAKRPRESAATAELRERRMLKLRRLLRALPHGVPLTTSAREAVSASIASQLGATAPGAPGADGPQLRAHAGDPSADAHFAMLATVAAHRAKPDARGAK